MPFRVTGFDGLAMGVHVMYLKCPNVDDVHCERLGLRSTRAGAVNDEFCAAVPQAPPAVFQKVTQARARIVPAATVPLPLCQKCMFIALMDCAGKSVESSHAHQLLCWLWNTGPNVASDVNPELPAMQGVRFSLAA